MTQTWTPTHPQVITIRGIEVDKDMAPLLEALWRQGYQTEFSCQGTDDHDAHIAFHNPEHAARFAGSASKVRVCGRWADFPADLIGHLTRRYSSQ